MQKFARFQDSQYTDDGPRKGAIAVSNLWYSGIVDRPKTLLIVGQSGRVQPLEVLFVRVYSTAYKRRQLTAQPVDTIALQVTPEMMAANQPIRYADDLVVRGSLETAHVLTNPQDRRQVMSLLRTNRDKLLQLQDDWFNRYIGDPKAPSNWAKQLAKATKAWPLGLQLAVYQQRVLRIAWQHRGATRKTIYALQRHQSSVNKQTQAAIMALTTPLALLRKPTKRVFTNPLFGRPQRERAIVDLAELADQEAYAHSQAQAIMQDYLFAQAHDLPLSGKGTPLNDAELAQWQAWVDAHYHS